MMSFLNALLGRRRFIVKEPERAIVLRKGEVSDLLLPGEHWLADGAHVELIRFDTRVAEFHSPCEKALFDKVPDVAARQLTVIRTSKDEVAVIERDGVAFDVITPERKVLLWTDAGPWTVTKVDVSASPEVEPELLRRLTLAKRLEALKSHLVSEGHVGLVFVDGVHRRTLTPGTYGFWSVGRSLVVHVVDTRRSPLEITGQELLTRDRVTIRVNVSAEYTVSDPLRAVTTVPKYQDALYRALQVGVRKTLGTLTLDQILDRKASLDEEAAAKVRSDMQEIGLSVGDITLKDVILPGEMREILNQVVAAQKQAEANVIRRREETNATRSLLNTAKVMEENPVMLRLKELEALEAIAGKVERLTVHNGTGGLLNDLVKLRD